MAESRARVIKGMAESRARAKRGERRGWWARQAESKTKKQTDSLLLLIRRIEKDCERERQVGQGKGTWVATNSSFYVSQPPRT
jgi:phage gp46-like protein